MNTSTSLSIVAGCVLYYILLALVFTVSPPEILGGCTMTGVNLATASTNVTASSDGTASATSFSSFSANIDCLPLWADIVFIWLPGIILGLGIYGLIRGL